MAVFSEIKENMFTVNKKIKKSTYKNYWKKQNGISRPENYSIWKVHIASKW